MGRTDEVRERYERLNARDFDTGLDVISEDVTFHAPGLGEDVQGRDAAIDVVKGFAASGDVHWEYLDATELGPFVASHAKATGALDGARHTWDLLQIERYEGDKVVEMWSLRGGAPQPMAD